MPTAIRADRPGVAARQRKKAADTHLSLFALALAVAEDGRARYWWLAAALAANFFAVWSQGSGLFLTGATG